MLETKRLLFKTYEDADKEFLYSLLSNQKMMQFIGNGETRDHEGTDRFFNWIQNAYKRDPRLGLHLLIRKDDQKPIGHAGIVPQVVEGTEELEIGYWIAEPYWGQGFASEAALALKKFGEHDLKKRRFISLIQEGNTVSQMIAQKLGMSIENVIEKGNKTVLVYATAEQ